MKEYGCFKLPDQLLVAKIKPGNLFTKLMLPFLNIITYIGIEKNILKECVNKETSLCSMLPRVDVRNGEYIWRTEK